MHYYLYSGKCVSFGGVDCRCLFSVRGIYGGVTCDQLGNVLATRTEKSRHYVQVSSAEQFKTDGRSQLVVNAVVRKFHFR